MSKTAVARVAEEARDDAKRCLDLLRTHGIDLLDAKDFAIAAEYDRLSSAMIYRMAMRRFLSHLEDTVGSRR